MVYTQETFYFDHSSPEIQKMVESIKNLVSDQEKIEQLYLKVRDGWRYNPYNIGLTPAHYKASAIARKTVGHCIDKAILYVAGLRALHIPARLRLAKVTNHIATEHLEETLGSHEIAPHGLVDVFLNGKWFKCSPAFNKELCDRYNVAPLEFDGTQDSIFQEYNRDNKQFMEYMEDYGHFEDVPIDFIFKTFQDTYPEVSKKIQGAKEIKIK